MPPHILERLLSPFRTFGLIAGAFYAMSRIFALLSPSISLIWHDWMVQPITGKAILPASLEKSYTARFIESDEKLVSEMPIRPDVLLSRRRQGARCLGAFRRDELVGYVWFVAGTYEEDEARCNFQMDCPAEAVFDFDVFVLPEHRGGVAFAAVWHFANTLLFDRGIRNSFSRLNRFNHVSARAHKHFGWRRVGRAVVLRMWSVELLLASQRPRVFLSLHEGARTTYRLRAPEDGG